MPEEKVSQKPNQRIGHATNCLYSQAYGTACTCGAAADAGPRQPDTHFEPKWVCRNCGKVDNLHSSDGRCLTNRSLAAPPVPQEAAPQPPSVEWSRNHLAHVQRFLIEMYQTMVDPCDEFKGNIAELCELLLKMARDQREREHERMTKADLLTNSIRFSEQATAPDWAMRRVREYRNTFGAGANPRWTDEMVADLMEAGSEREREVVELCAKWLEHEAELINHHSAATLQIAAKGLRASRLLGGEAK